ncbi:hypothetical protein [Haloterrigena salifodinae]|nr:hypothetical protein [Haloterrigena salifodinae]
MDIIWYNRPWFNWGLLLAGIGLTIVLYWARMATGEAEDIRS